MAHHPIVHIELSANSNEEARAFYEDIFGWEMQEFPDMNYVGWRSAANGMGGGFNVASDFTPAGTTVVYIQTDDLQDSIEKVQSHGGTIMGEQLDIPGVGTMVWFNDPAGNRMALLQPLPETRMPESSD